jgi:hypothetical protein
MNKVLNLEPEYEVQARRDSFYVKYVTEHPGWTAWQLGTDIGKDRWTVARALGGLVYEGRLIERGGRYYSSIAAASLAGEAL